MDNEKRAHDLALLYLQLEIKEGKLSTSINTSMTALLSSLRTCNRCVL